MAEQKVTIGDVTFVIDQNAGTPQEREEFFKELTNLSYVPEYIEALTNTDHRLPDGEVIDLLQKSEGFPENQVCDSMLKGDRGPFQHGRF